MEIFRNISTSTVSRDLKIEVELGILKSIGNKIKQNIPFRITKHLTRLQAKFECLVIVIFHKSIYINEKTNIR